VRFPTGLAARAARYSRSPGERTRQRYPGPAKAGRRIGFGADAFRVPNSVGLVEPLLGPSSISCQRQAEQPSLAAAHRLPRAPPDAASPSAPAAPVEYRQSQRRRLSPAVVMGLTSTACHSGSLTVPGRFPPIGGSSCVLALRVYRPPGGRRCGTPSAVWRWPAWCAVPPVTARSP
jgi:hypothetical protein